MLQTLVSLFSEYEIVVYTYSDKICKAVYELTGGAIHIITQNRISTFFQFLKDTSTASAVMWGGGTCFMDEGGDGAIKYFLLARLFCKKIYYVGIGIGKTKKIRTKIILAGALLISSKIYLREFDAAKKFPGFYRKKISYVPDLVYRYPLLVNKINNDFSSNSLLVAYRNVEDYFGRAKSKDYLRNFCRAINCLFEHGDFSKIVLVNTDSECDSEDLFFIEKNIFPSGSIEIISIDNGISRVVEEISKASYIITARLHVALMAFANSRKFCLLNYSPKNVSFLEQAGVDGALIEYSDLDDPCVFVDIRNKFYASNFDLISLSGEIDRVVSEIKSSI
ncbi:polysaccharide pyruvyl transferase [Azonexus fungiphilus]|uniref:Polysaccharide pyruvyl transferase n=2 Tax=Azonexus fungiphilus TaxID=146940 RepID=A0A495WGG4_9RHOO|nr:polysaccharide pyruvyl transferase [Azonexus fungiphilus]